MDELHQLHDYLGFVPVKEYERLKAQNAELFEALKNIRNYCDDDNGFYAHVIVMLCDDALAKVE